jgi:hypothetical protein
MWITRGFIIADFHDRDDLTVADGVVDELVASLNWTGRMPLAEPHLAEQLFALDRPCVRNPPVRRTNELEPGGHRPMTFYQIVVGTLSADPLAGEFRQQPYADASEDFLAARLPQTGVDPV